MSRLLTKPLYSFTLYALLILAASIPVYYFTIDHIWLDELDEHNSIVHHDIEKKLKQLSEAELKRTMEMWNILQPGTNLQPVSQPGNDSVYTIRKKSSFVEGEVDRFRVLSSYFQIHGQHYHLTVETNVEESDETIFAIGLITLSFLLILIGGFIILNHKISKKIWKPFRRTLEQVSAFDINSDSGIRFEKSSVVEFEELNQTLTRLIERNVFSYNHQKRFIENASHELQTPLSVLRSKIDLLLQNQEGNPEQRKMIESLELPMNRLSRINKNLLLLAKIENNQFADTANLDIKSLVEENLELFIDYMESKEVRYNLTTGDHIRSAANKFLAESVIQNLFINAIQHTPKDGTILIEIRNQILFISNPGTAPLDPAILFERFATNSSGSTSNGLGLSIVKDICTRYGWSIDYTFRENRHNFSIIF